MTTPAKLYGKDLSEYDDIDVETLLAQLSPEEINILAKEVDPDVSCIAIKNVINILILYLIFRTHFCHQINEPVMHVSNPQQDHWTVKH